jgi:hypothetical protein
MPLDTNNCTTLLVRIPIAWFEVRTVLSAVRLRCTLRQGRSCTPDTGLCMRSRPASPLLAGRRMTPRRAACCLRHVGSKRGVQGCPIRPTTGPLRAQRLDTVQYGCCQLCDIGAADDGCMCGIPCQLYRAARREGCSQAARNAVLAQ